VPWKQVLFSEPAGNSFLEKQIVYEHFLQEKEKI